MRWMQESNKCIDAVECKAEWNKQLCLHIVQVLGFRCLLNGLLGAGPFLLVCSNKLK